MSWYDQPITDRQLESIEELEVMLSGFENIKFIKAEPKTKGEAGKYISYLLALINSL